MKKIWGLAMAAMLSFGSLCFAADGALLNKLQKNSDVLLGMFDNTQPVTYGAVIKTMSSETLQNFNEQKYNEVKKAVSDQFGRYKGSKFVAFQRTDQADLVVYFAEFSKEPVVNMTFIFNKDGQLLDYQLSPVKQEQETGK